MVALCHWWGRSGAAAQILPRPPRPLLPDKFYEPLPGGFTHVLLINSHNLVTSQELVLRGASCRGEERGMSFGAAVGNTQVWARATVPERAELNRARLAETARPAGDDAG